MDRKDTELIAIRKRSQFKFLQVLSMTCSCAMCPSFQYFLLLPYETVTLHSQTIFIQPFITIIKHMHEQKINSKRQRSQKPGFERLIFIFLSCLLFFYAALFFLLGKIERDMPFLSDCASLWCFSGLLFCIRPAQSHAQPWQSSQWITQTHVNTSTEPPTTPENAPAKCTMNVTCFNKCSQRAMARLNQQEQLLYHDISVNNTSRFINQVMAVLKLDRMYYCPLIMSMKCGVWSQQQYIQLDFQNIDNN